MLFKREPGMWFYQKIICRDWCKQVIDIVKKNKVDIPLIVVSNHVSDEVVEHLMALGAYDFLTKANLAKLVPVIRRSINESKNYQRFISTQSALQKRGAFSSYYIQSSWCCFSIPTEH